VTDPGTCQLGTFNGVMSVAWNPAHWMSVQVGSGGSPVVCLDSGVPATQQAWYTLTISFQSSTATVTYTISGGHAASISGGQSTDGVSPVIVATCHGTSSADVYLDWFSFIGYGLSR